MDTPKIPPFLIVMTICIFTFIVVGMVFAIQDTRDVCRDETNHRHIAEMEVPQ